MKKLLGLLLLLITTLGFAQSPAGINYQAVARDANGELLKNQTIKVQFTILLISMDSLLLLLVMVLLLWALMY